MQRGCASQNHDWGPGMWSDVLSRGRWDYIRYEVWAPHPPAQNCLKSPLLVEHSLYSLMVSEALHTTDHLTFTQPSSPPTTTPVCTTNATATLISWLYRQEASLSLLCPTTTCQSKPSFSGQHKSPSDGSPSWTLHVSLNISSSISSFPTCPI